MKINHTRFSLLALLALALIVTGCTTGCTGKSITPPRTKLVDSFTSRTEQGADYSESGYDMSVELDKLPASDLTGQVNEARAIIKQQFAYYQPLDSHYPSVFQEDFDTRAEALEYVGCAGLNDFKSGMTEKGSTVRVMGDQDGTLLMIDIETYYDANGYSLSLLTRIYTENCQGDITERRRTTEDIKYTQAVYTAPNGKQCDIITSSVNDADVVTADCFVVESNVLYNAHIACPSGESEHAVQIIESLCALLMT